MQRLTEQGLRWGLRHSTVIAASISSPGSPVQTLDADSRCCMSVVAAGFAGRRIVVLRWSVGCRAREKQQAPGDVGFVIVGPQLRVRCYANRR